MSSDWLNENESDEDGFQQISDNEYRKMQSKMEKIGYADGVTDGHNSTFQKGFDEGYKDGLKEGFELDKFKHFFERLNGAEEDEIAQEKEKYLQILSQKVDNENNKERFDRIIAKLAVEIPKTFKLLQKQDNVNL